MGPIAPLVYSRNASQSTRCHNSPSNQVSTTAPIITEMGTSTYSASRSSPNVSQTTRFHDCQLDQNSITALTTVELGISTQKVIHVPKMSQVLSLF